MNCPELIQQYCVQFEHLASSATFQDWGIIGLFINALLSATALPIPTELLTASLIAGGENKIILVLILLTGSSIGGFLNYFLGLGGNKLGNKIRKVIKKLRHKDNDILMFDESHNYQPINDHLKNIDLERKKGHKYLDKLGPLAILFSPFILVAGDLILISAGARKYDFRKFTFLMLLGKLIKALVTVFGLGILFV